jgi:hypothetical protein
MLCPKCKTELSLDHVTEYTNPDTGTKTTNYFYTCTNPPCENYLTILNGCEKGEAAQMQPN